MDSEIQKALAKVAESQERIERAATELASSASERSRKSQPSDQGVFAGLDDWLRLRGWKKDPVRWRVPGDADVLWFKLFPTRTACSNHDDEVMIAVKGYDYTRWGKDQQSFEIVLSESPARKARWYQLMTYGLDEAELKERLDDEVTRLLAMWEICGQ